MTETLAPNLKGALESVYMTWDQRVQEALAAVYADLSAEPWITQVTAAPELDAALKAAVREVAERRRVAVRQLVADGWSLTDIAQETGLSVNRILQIERGKERG